jgi:hypothetical protein
MQTKTQSVALIRFRWRRNTLNHAADRHHYMKTNWNQGTPNSIMLHAHQRMLTSHSAHTRILIPPQTQTNYSPSDIAIHRNATHRINLFTLSLRWNIWNHNEYWLPWLTHFYSRVFAWAPVQLSFKQIIAVRLTWLTLHSWTVKVAEGKEVGRGSLPWKHINTTSTLTWATYHNIPCA